MISKIISFIIGVAVGLISGIGVTEYRLRRKESYQESKETRKWYERAYSLTNQAIVLWEENFERSERPDYREIQTEADLLSGQMNRHAAQAIVANGKIAESLKSLAGKLKDIERFSLTIGKNKELIQAGEEMKDSALKLKDEIEEYI